MGNYSYIVEQIKERVTLVDVIQRYTGETPRRGKMCCPLHGEKTASFTVYDNNTFYCFGCGASGDVITFAQRYFNLGFMDALRRIDDDYRLGLLERPSLSAYRRAVQAAHEREKERRQKQEQAAQIEAEYWKAFDTVLQYEKNIRELCPASSDEKLQPAFVEAIKNIEHARYALECAEQERRKQTSGKPNTTHDGSAAAKPGNL